MAEPKYFIQFHLNRYLATVALKTLDDHQLLSEVAIEWVAIDNENQADALAALKEQAVTATRQCVVSANAAPGKISELQLIANEEIFFFGINSKNTADSLVIGNLDSFDEQLQQCIDLVKLRYRKSFTDFTFMPFHSWLALQFSADKERLFIFDEKAEASIFYHAENKSWHKGALDALNLKDCQLPTAIKVGESVGFNEVGLVTSVAEIEINFQ